MGVRSNTVTWTLALFFGCAIVFGVLRRLTQGSGAGVTLAVQFAALLLIVTALVLIMRRRGSG